MKKKTYMLIILDGWGIGADEPTNAVLVADTPFIDRLQSSYPMTQLRCSGQDVGLPTGIMGNSEVGHMNIGAGRVVYQDLVRIDKAIEDGSFFDNPSLGAIMDAVAARGKALHLMGLLSDGGVHSQFTHLLALLDMAQRKGLSTVFVHAVLDGRGYTAGRRRELYETADGPYPNHRQRRGRIRLRTLLCHGPGQTMGSGGKSLPALFGRPWPSGTRSGGRRKKTPTVVVRPMNSSSRW